MSSRPSCCDRREKVYSAVLTFPIRGRIRLECLQVLEHPRGNALRRVGLPPGPDEGAQDVGSGVAARCSLATAASRCRRDREVNADVLKRVVFELLRLMI